MWDYKWDQYSMVHGEIISIWTTWMSNTFICTSNVVPPGTSTITYNYPNIHMQTHTHTFRIWLWLSPWFQSVDTLGLQPQSSQVKLLRQEVKLRQRTPEGKGRWFCFVFFHIYAKEITGKMLKNFCIYIYNPSNILFCRFVFPRFHFLGIQEFWAVSWLLDEWPFAVCCCGKTNKKIGPWHIWKSLIMSDLDRPGTYFCVYVCCSLLA